MYRRIVSCLRIRPFSAHELSRHSQNCINSDDTNRVSVTGSDLSLRFDFLYPQNLLDTSIPTSFNIIFETLGAKIIEDMLSDRNVMYMSYGEGAAGKTFTIYGREEHDGLAGFVMRELLVKNEGKHIAYELEMFELYNEELKDLFDEKAKLILRMSKQKDKVSLEGITRKKFSSYEEFRALINQGRKALAKNCHMMNVLSGRSHVQLNIRIISEVREQELVFLDLAGSQRIGKTGATSVRQNQIISIGKALSSIHQVLTSILRNKQHIPFRDSKLTYANMTRLINYHLITMFNISPASSNKDETISTLRFAQQLIEH